MFGGHSPWVLSGLWQNHLSPGSHPACRSRSASRIPAGLQPAPPSGSNFSQGGTVPALTPPQPASAGLLDQCFSPDSAPEIQPRPSSRASRKGSPKSPAFARSMFVTSCSGMGRCVIWRHLPGDSESDSRSLLRFRAACVRFVRREVADAHQFQNMERPDPLWLRAVIMTGHAFDVSSRSMSGRKQLR